MKKIILLLFILISTIACKSDSDQDPQVNIIQEQTEESPVDYVQMPTPVCKQTVFSSRFQGTYLSENRIETGDWLYFVNHSYFDGDIPMAKVNSLSTTLSALIEDAINDAAKRHHTNWRLRTIESIDHNISEDMHFSTVVSIGINDVPAIKEILIQAIEECRKVIKDSRKNVFKVYALIFLT